MSTSPPPLDLVLLWHFHQPDYRESGSGRARLSWVRLHAAKDYLDMARRLEAHEGAHVTFNLVPVLLDQLEDAVRGGSDALFDLLARAADSLSPDERREVVARCAQAPPGAFERWPEYRLLAAGLARSGEDSGDIVALETWFLLAWLDPLWLAEREAARALSAGGRFTIEHRDALLALHARIVSQVIPTYRDLAARGRIEISASPYYHPILPLLVDPRAARRSRPDLPLPREPFAWPDDARIQIERAIARHAEVFGRRPAGMWPSEGSVSPEVAELAAAAGIRWLASDEGVLFRSLPEGHLRRGAAYRPWALETPAGVIAIFFRDRELSDRIGFVYQRWDPAEAVADFVGRLRKIAREHAGDESPVVSVILDGENCWEGYAEDGGPFLDRLYTALEQAPDIRMRTPSEVLDSARVVPLLSGLHSGSWIDADFHVWMGHPEKNRAWDLLARARRAMGEGGAGSPAALEALLKAEGSDWFWWFGDDHYTQDKPIFDELFRGHLRAIYEACGESVPAGLNFPIARGARKGDGRRTQVAFIEPVLDGRVTHFYEWQPAGHLPLAGSGSAMHATAGLASDLHYGFDREHFYLRLDFAAGGPPGAGHGLRLDWIEPAATRVEVGSLEPGEARVVRIGPSGSDTFPDARCRIGNILELALPRAALGLGPGALLEVLVQILEGGRPIETLPADDVVSDVVPDDSFDDSAWAP